MSAVYKPRYEDDANPPATENHRERSPRRNGRPSPSNELSTSQGIRKTDRSEKRSRSPSRKSSMSGIIKEAIDGKKDLGHKEREKKTEYKSEERELRFKETQRRREIERAKRKREDDEDRENRAKEAAKYKKARSVSSAGNVEPGLQQGDRSIVRDIHRPDRSTTVTTEYPERATSPRASQSDAGTRPPSSDVGPSNMTSNNLGTRSGLLLHITGLLMRYTSEISEQTALQLRRESAKKTLDQKKADYDKAQVVQVEFPSAAESTKASKERAQKEFERVDKELVKKREGSRKLVEEIAEQIVPVEESFKSNSGDVTGKLRELDEKFTQHREEWEVVKNKQHQLDQRFSMLLTEKGAQTIMTGVESEFSIIRQEFSACAARVSHLEAEIEQYKQSKDSVDLKIKIDELSTRVDGFQDMKGLVELEQDKQNNSPTDLRSKVNELSLKIDGLQVVQGQLEGLEQHKRSEDATDLKITLDSLSCRVDSLEITKSDLSSAVETIKGNLAVQSTAINDRTEIDSLHMLMKTLSRSQDEIRGSVTKLQTQMRALEKELRTDRLKMGGIDRRLTMHETNSLTTEVRLAIHDEIKAQQAAVDGVLNEKLGDLEGQLETVKGQFAELDHSLAALRDQYNTHVDRIGSDLDAVRGEINSAREESNISRQNDIQALQLAINNLDFRMNNLSTEHLYRQILGQMDAHLRGGRENIAMLELKMQGFEKRFSNGEGLVLSTSLRSEIDELIKSTRQGFLETNKALVDVMDRLRADVDINLSSLQQLREDVDSIFSSSQKVNDDIESSKAKILNDVDTLRTDLERAASNSQKLHEDLQTKFTDSTSSLRAEVNDVGLTLQTMQDELRDFRAATASLKDEVAKAAKTVFPEKRRFDSSSQEASTPLKTEMAKAAKTVFPDKRKADPPATTKTNGHKRKRRGPVVDTDSDDNT